MRSRKILQAARTEPCQFCFKQDGTTVAAHSNQQMHGKGMGIKASDEFVAFLCYSCHTAIDQGRALSKSDRRQMWQIAHERTRQILIDRGLLESAD